MTRRIVTPAEGLVVLDLHGRRLPKDGAWVDGNDSYWDRHHRDGAVTFSDQETETSEPEPEAKRPTRKSRKPTTETEE